MATEASVDAGAGRTFAELSGGEDKGPSLHLSTWTLRKGYSVAETALFH